MDGCRNDGITGRLRRALLGAALALALAALPVAPALAQGAGGPAGNVGPCNIDRPAGPRVLRIDSYNVPSPVAGGILIVNTRLAGGLTAAKVTVLDAQGHALGPDGRPYGEINMASVGLLYIATVPLSATLPAGDYHLRIELYDGRGNVSRYVSRGGDTYVRLMQGPQTPPDVAACRTPLALVRFQA